jgi:hypothetical protein
MYWERIIQFQNGAFRFFITNKNHQTLTDNQNSNSNKPSFEKERASQVSELLLKIFSSAKISITIKKKFGENFEIKLTGKQSDQKVIRFVENEVNELTEKEKNR